MASAAKVLQRIDLTLRSFYIFNSKFSTSDHEEHKILYYHPNDIELNTKINDVGLSEAIIAFTGTFTADDSGCHAVHTQKTTQLFYQPEPGYWMIMVINVPKEIRLKDGVEVSDYRGSEVHDRIYRAVLEQCYRTFRLFHGTFAMNLRGESEAAGREYLVDLLHAFYQKHISTLRLPHCDIWDALRSIQYLPLEKLLFLRAHNFIGMISATFPIIEDMLLLYNDQVVCSGKLDAIDLYVMHEYIRDILLVEQTQSFSLVETCPDGGIFVPTPLDESASSSASSSKLLTVFLQRENDDKTKPVLQAFDLIIYRALNAILCMFVRHGKELSPDFYTELATGMGPLLSTLARDINDAMLKQQEKRQSRPQSTTLCTTTTISTTDSLADLSTPKYLFIDEQSLKHLSNIGLGRRQQLKGSSTNLNSNTLPPNVMNLIADMRHHTDRLLVNTEDCNNSFSFSSFEEMQVKTTNDFWIVKRRCNWRQYFVIVCNSKATLLDVTQEAKRIFEQELTDDVFFDK